MSPVQPQQLTASSVRVLYWALVGGLATIIAVFASLFWLGSAPLLAANPNADTLIAPAAAAVAAFPIALGWLWGRPNLPLRHPSQPPGAYWEDPTAGARALLLWVLWEGGTIIASVGSLLTGSVLTEAVGATGLALLLTHSPSFLEGRTS